jgi:hypothetical protein
MGIRILATRGDVTGLEASDATPQGGAGTRSGIDGIRCRVQTASVRPATAPVHPDRVPR